MKRKLGIIGVIILAIIILIVASITYSYVESIRIKPVSEISDHFEGIVLEIMKEDIISYHKKEYQVYNVKILHPDNKTISYDMFFYDLYPPLENLNMQLYYDYITLESESFYRIVRIELI
jgi:hypothetical protein